MQAQMKMLEQSVNALAVRLGIASEAGERQSSAKAC